MKKNIPFSELVDNALYKSNRSHLVRKQVYDKNGHRKTVWVKPEVTKNKNKHSAVNSVTTGKSLKKYTPDELRKVVINKMLDNNKTWSFDEFKNTVKELKIENNENTRVMLENTDNLVFVNAIYAETCERKTKQVKIKVKKYKGFTNVIGDKKAGKPMSFTEANRSYGNPNYGKDWRCGLNCASCVAAFEARLRGFDVQAKPFIINGSTHQLGLYPTLIWKGKKVSDFIQCKETDTDKVFEELKNTISKNERYEVRYKLSQSNYHVVVIGKDNSDNIYMYDPQTSDFFYKDNEVKRVISENTDYSYMRIDNVDFNPNFAFKVME